MAVMSTSLQFAQAVRTLSESARLQGLLVPMFRSPPRTPGAVRTVRRTRRGTTVAVVVAGRPWTNVLADLIDGIVVVNGLAGHGAIRSRTALWSALERDDVLAA